MRGFLNGLLVGMIIGIAGYWYLDKKAKEHPEAEQRATAAAADARTTAAQTAHNISDAVQAKLDTLDLRSDEIKSEMTQTGKVVRQRAKELGNDVADAAADARIVATVKSKYAESPDLSVWNISVSCDQGRVTLSGNVSNEVYIGEAVALALEVDGVRDVTSTLTVKPGST